MNKTALKLSKIAKKRQRDESGRFKIEYDFSPKDVVFLYKNKALAVRKIAKKFKCGRSVIKRILRKEGFKIRDNTESRQPGTAYHKWAKRRMSGKNHPAFKGIYLNRKNYVIIWKQGKQILQHKDIMETHLRRKLKNNEWIHHIDGNRQNNKIENLALCDQSIHQGIHGSLQNIGYQLIRVGIIKFDKNINQYYINKYLLQMIENRNIPMEQIKEEIRSLLSDKKLWYADEIANELNLDIKDVVEAFKQLQEEGKLFEEENKLL